MPLTDPSFTIGIEEEYLLVERDSRDLVRIMPDGLLETCQQELGKQVTPELFQSQIEVGTAVCERTDELGAELKRLRDTIDDAASGYGLAPIAASTHPYADWSGQVPTPRQRYLDLADDMQLSARRLVISGMHVHVGIEDEELRVDLMKQAAYFLPHLLALSVSSPFWRGEDSGLACYRLTVFDGLPRTGIPEEFASWREYRRMVDAVVGAGIIEDASKIWWDLRPSETYPTLEMRITDLCPRIEDALSIACLFRCLLRMLYRLRVNNQRWRTYPRFLISENRWRAQRYGGTAGLIDLGKNEVVPYADLLEELIDLVSEDARFFGCVDEVSRTRDIIAGGTSAERQRRTFADVVDGGGSRSDALQAVVDLLIRETTAV